MADPKLGRKNAEGLSNQSEEVDVHRTCEICGEVVTLPTRAMCGHKTWLCGICKQQCPGALQECTDCENGERVVVENNQL